MKRPVVLTIAGSDPSGGAGIQADLRVFSELHARGLSAITAVTAQNNRGVEQVYQLPASLVSKQTSVLLDEFKPDATKIGMPGADSALEAIASIIKKFDLKNVVLDTVLKSSNDFPLSGKRSIKLIIKMLPLVTIVTPNIPEAEALTGLKVKNTADMKNAAMCLHELGAPNVLIKGGHLNSAPVDILYDGTGFTSFTGRRIKGKKEIFHGTGCILSAAIAAHLAKGLALKRAIKAAKGYLKAAIKERKDR